jgi:hypothetical protein
METGAHCARRDSQHAGNMARVHALDGAQQKHFAKHLREAFDFGAETIQKDPVIRVSRAVGNRWLEVTQAVKSLSRSPIALPDIEAAT